MRFCSRRRLRKTEDRAAGERHSAPGVTLLRGAESCSRASVPRPVLTCSRARCPGRMLWIVRTNPVEVRSSAKIALHESGLRPPPHPSSQVEQARLPATATTASHDDFMFSRGKHHAKASRLRVWKQIAGGGAIPQERIEVSPVGTLWNTRFVVDCVGKRGFEIWTTTCAKQKRTRFSSRPCI